MDQNFIKREKMINKSKINNINIFFLDTMYYELVFMYSILYRFLIVRNEHGFVRIKSFIILRTKKC